MPDHLFGSVMSDGHRALDAQQDVQAAYWFRRAAEYASVNEQRSQARQMAGVALRKLGDFAAAADELETAISYEAISDLQLGKACRDLAMIYIDMAKATTNLSEQSKLLDKARVLLLQSREKLKRSGDMVELGMTTSFLGRLVVTKYPLNTMTAAFWMRMAIPYVRSNKVYALNNVLTLMALTRRLFWQYLPYALWLGLRYPENHGRLRSLAAKKADGFINLRGLSKG
ncbi:MAG: hypothetical protein JWN33_601 [Candidatus Saccharibacteria bacterium]|nr:hypothetical protein [Candidatus Saccharibacteria bacterium]